MTSNPEFFLELLTAKDAKQADLEKNLVPRLKEDITLFHSHFQALYEFLLSKGAIKADPYKNERHLSDISAPQDPFMSDAELEDQLPIRIAEYDNTLDFLVNYTQFTVSDLSLKRLKVILAIIKFINWSSLSVTSNSPSTRGLAMIIDKIRLGKDNMAVGAVNSSHNALDKLSHQIQKQLKVVADFKREEYKLRIREHILANTGMKPDISKDDFTRTVKQHFAKHLPSEGFFPELVQELWDDLTHEGSETYRQEMLQRFHVEAAKKKADTTNKIDLRAILFEGIRAVGTNTRHLEESVTKLEENHQILINRPRSFFERFKEWILKLSGAQSKEHKYQIELIDVVTTMKRFETISFESFSAGLAKKARQLSALASKTSTLYTKLDQAGDDEVYEFLNKTYRDLRDYHEKLDALDTFLKTEVPHSERPKLRGIKVELTALKNGISLVNQRLHEYVARKEEIEQLRKLGINTGH